MAGMKRERMEEVCESQLNPNIIIQQPFYVNPIHTVNGEQYVEIDPSQIIRDVNPQLNLFYLVVPKDANPGEGFSPMYVVSNNQQPVVSDSRQLDKHHKIVSSSKIDDDVVYIPDDSLAETTKKPNLCATHLNDYEPEMDPLEIREHVSYAVAKRYNEAVQDSPAENVIKHDEFTWKTHIKCHIPSCEVVLTSHYEKKLHMDDHNYPSGTSFKCSICNMRFPHAIDRNKHVETHSVAETYKCDGCLKRFPYYTSYVQHLRKENCPNTTLACYLCGTFFAHEHDLRNHIQNDVFTCICCTKICNSDIDSHYNTCHVYKKKLTQSKKKKTSNIDEVIVLD